MNRATAFLPVKGKFEQIYPVKGLGGVVSALTPKKQNNGFGEGEVVIAKEKMDPIATFSKPPPLPPVLTPLVLLSLWGTWSNRDGDEN